MKHFPQLLALAAAAAYVASAHAIVVTGTTAGGPTWTRPVAGNPPTPPLSGVGVGVNYAVTPFFVSAAGSYVFQSTATAPVNWDNYTFLYATSFNPASQFTNVLIGNDDNTTIGLSGFSYALTANTQYVFVTTGFAPGDAGAWSLSITGPGNITLGAVPEPATYATMALGLAGLLAARRRRS